jgi:hypothetical protein
MRGREAAPDSRVCMVCGRAIEWRRKWARDWEHVKYCSEGCRTRRASPTREPMQQAIVELLRARPRGATICPSEAARVVGGDDWRSHMDDARAAARLLVAQGLVEITQGGSVVDPSTARGAIRVRASAALLTGPTDAVEQVPRRRPRDTDR